MVPPIVPLIATGSVALGTAILTWYMRLTKLQREEADAKVYVWFKEEVLSARAQRAVVDEERQPDQTYSAVVH